MAQTPLVRPRSKPYNRTPLRAKIFDRQAELFDESQTEDVDNAVAEIAKKTWKLHRMSPLYNFKYEDLKNYSNLLSTYVESLKTKGVGFLVNSSHKWTADFSMFHGLKCSAENAEAVCITISVKLSAGTSKNVFSGILLCCNSGVTPAILVRPKFTVFPIFMTRGHEAIRKMVLTFLKEEFDCYICPMLFSPVQLEWIFSVWPLVDSGHGHMQPAPELTYSLPTNKGIDTVRISMDKDSVGKIWNEVHDVNAAELHVEEMRSFMTRWERHFRDTININPASFKLMAVKTPVLLAHCKGKIKIQRKEYVKKVLQHVTETALQVYSSD